ncbi:MAG: hypothetical protein BGN96_05740 [Bacteroidales bacterium 45-6]|nr:MAG: hypothetical protein BGN96_05740 [Bacteroidales bacterium 45-6]
MKKLQTYLQFFLLLIVVGAYAQTPAIGWQKTLGGSNYEEGEFIIQTSDGGYAIAGYTQSTDGDISGNHGGYDAFVVKLNAAGAIEWKKTYGGTGDDRVNSFVQTADGGYIMGGHTTSTDGDAVGSGYHGGTGNDAWVVKINAAGNIIWQKAYGGTQNEYINSIIATSDGGYILGCYTYSTDGYVSGNHGDADIWIVKINSSGTIVWQKALGGTDTEWISVYSIVQTSDGGYLLAGSTYSTDGDVTGNHGDRDIWLVKLDATGNISWKKTIGGTSDDKAFSIAPTSDGNYILSGQTFSSDGDVTGNHSSGDIWILKLTATGNIIWQKALGSSTNDWAWQTVTANDGGYIIAGTSSSNDGDVTGFHGDHDFWMVKLDATGNLIWQKSLGGSGYEEAYSLVATTDGGCVVTGATRSNDGDVIGNHGGGDTWVVKLSPATVNTVPNQIVCTGNTSSAINFSSPTPVSGVTITGYSWTNDNTSIGLAANGTGNIPAFTATNNGTTTVMATIVVSPIYTYGATTYTGSPITFTIMVNPAGSCSSSYCFKDVSAGGNHSAGIRTDGTLWTWGYNLYGQLGNGNNSTSTTPVKISNYTWKQISTGTYFTLAIRDDGTLWAWGVNSNGQLGNGTTNNSNIPVQIGAGYTWKQVAAGSSHSLAIRDDGTLWAWGYNVYSQLGTGNTTDSSIPVKVGTATNWSQIAAGNYHSIGIQSDGSLWVWGSNAYGQMGNSSTGTNLTVPTKIGTGSTWKQVTAGSDHNLAIKADGTLWTWGRNDFGQLGNGNAINSSSFVQVAGSWSSVSSRNFHNTAIKADGTLWTWGYNLYGALGNGNNSNSNIPVQVGTDIDWVRTSSGVYHSLGIKKGGALWTWGYNRYGQLGNGSITNTNIPVLIQSGCPTVFVSTGSGYLSSFASCSGSASATQTFTVSALNLSNVLTITAPAGFEVSKTSNSGFAGTVTLSPVSGNVASTTIYIRQAASASGLVSGNVSVQSTDAITQTLAVNGEATVAGNMNAVTSQTICNGGGATTAVKFSSPFTNNNAITYNWVNNNTAIGLAASGTGDIPSFTATNSGTAPVTSTVTVTPYFGPLYNGPAIPASPTLNYAGLLVTYSNVSINGGGNSATVSSGATVSISYNVNPNGNNLDCSGCFYQRYIGIGSTNTIIDCEAYGIRSYDPQSRNLNFTAPTVPGIYYITQGGSLSFSCAGSFNFPNTYSDAIGVIVVAPLCPGAPQTFTYTVNPMPKVNAVNDLVVCAGSPTTVNFSGTTGTTYNFTNSNAAIGLAASGSGNLSFTTTNTTTAPITATITVTPVIGPCAGTPITFKITVNPSVVMTAINNQFVCNGATVPAISLSSTTTTTGNDAITYTWTNSNTAIGLAASGTGNIPSFTATNNSTAPVTSTITVTPAYRSRPLYSGQAIPTTRILNYQGLSVTYSNISINGGGTAVTVSPGATVGISYSVSPNASNLACSSCFYQRYIGIGSTNTSIECINYYFYDSQNINRSFTAPTVPGTYYITQTGSLDSDCHTVDFPNTYSDAIAVIVVAPFCSGTPQTFTYTVNPTATVNTVANQTVCNNATVPTMTFSSPTTTIGNDIITYSWTNNNAAIGLATSGTGNIPSFKAINNNGSPVTATVTVTPNYRSQPVYSGQTIPSPVTQIYSDRPFTYSNVSINGGGNSATVSPGATVNISYRVLLENVPDEGAIYCPLCSFQSSIGVGSTNTIIGCKNWNFFGQSQSFNTSFTAPSAPGVYYLTQVGSLEVVCPSNINFPNTYSDAIAVIVVGTICSGTPKTFTYTVNPAGSCTVFAKVKALLKGPLSGTTMSTTLNTANLIPLTQPYSGAPWNYAGTSTESVTAIPANVTDWVLVELRDATTPATVVATRAAFILSDGNIVDVDGVSPVEFTDIAAGNYHIAVKHRNHLAIRTATAQALGGSASGATLYDFTTAQTQANGTNPMVQSGTVYAMWSGDVNADGNVYNTASPQDASQVVNGVANKTGNTFHLPSYGGYKNVYNILDVNMDGNVFNTATPQDASNIVNNVANAPGNTFHLPSYSGLKAKL